MTICSLRHALLFCLLSGLLLNHLTAVEYTLTMDPPPSGLSEARFELWIPDALPAGQPVRGVLGSSNYHAGAGVYSETAWRNFAAARNLGIIRYLVRVGADPIGTDTASANAVLSALTQFAGQAGRPELQYTGIVPTGLSWGAHQVCQFHRHIPSRVICSVAFRGTASDITTAANAKNIPLLHKSAGQESFDGYRTEQSHSAFANMGTSGNALYDANFANTVGPNEPHHELGDLTFVHLWLDEVITARLPATIPANSAVTLRAMDQTASWSGYYEVSTSLSGAPWQGGRGFINATIAACTGGVRPSNIRTWLSSQRLANAWVAYANTGITPTSPVTVSITSPANNTFVTPGSAVTVTASASTSAGTISKVEFFEGVTLLGTDTSSAGGWTYTYSAISAGVHAVTAKAFAGTETNTSAPVTILAENARDADNPSSTVNGLDYQYYTGTGDTLPDFTGLTPNVVGTVANYSLTPRTQENNFAFRYTGFVDVPQEAAYTFFTTSDDGSKLLIGDRLVVGNDGSHGMVEQSGIIRLKTGKHAITVLYTQGGGGYGLEVRYEGGGLSKQLIPDNKLFRQTSGGTPVAPAITSQPSNQTVTAGATAAFTVAASGTGPLSYQWKRGTTNLGGNSATLSITNAQAANAGSYTVVVTNSVSSVTSNAATLTVNTVAATPPTVATAANGPGGAVSGTTAALSVLGGPAGSESTYTYTWSVVSAPSGGTATFSPNGSNAAKNATATFNRVGAWQVQAVITNPSNGTSTISGPVTITVSATFTSVVVSGPATVVAGTSAQFTAQGRDQFAQALSSQPTFTWSATGGTVTSAGLFTAAATAGAGQVTATSGGKSGQAATSVTAAGAGGGAPPSSESTSGSSCGLGSGLAALVLLLAVGVRLRLGRRW